MTDARRAFDDLREVASSLNQQTDLLNDSIATFEKGIYDLNLGFTQWMSTPIVAPEGLGDWGIHLGWTRGPRDWGLYLRTQRDGEPYPDSEPWRLRDASREHRILALQVLPDLLVELKAEAQRLLNELQTANLAHVIRSLVKE